MLEEHYHKCIEDENIEEAKKANERILLFREMEKEKMKSEAKIIYSNQQNLVEKKMNEDLDNYLQETDQEFTNLTQAFETQEVELLKTHQKEIEEFKSLFEEEYNKKKPKYCRECLNWMKIKEVCMKKNQFERAKEATEKINKLREKDLQKFEEEKNNKLKSDLKSILKRHENEKNALALKKKSCIDMFVQTRDKNLEHIKKKFEGKLKELKNYQDLEMANFNKITRGITTPCARIQSIVTSATGIKDFDKNEDDINEDQNDEQDEPEEEHVPTNQDKDEEEKQEENDAVDDALQGHDEEGNNDFEGNEENNGINEEQEEGFEEN